MSDFVHTADVEIRNPEGLHLRPATAISQFVSKKDVRVDVVREDLVVDASSVLDLITLAASQGTVLTLRVAGSDAELVLATLVHYFNSGFEQGGLAPPTTGKGPAHD